MRRFFLFRSASLLFLLLLALPAWAGWKTPRENLDQRQVLGEIRIYYSLEGENAFPANAPFRQRNGQGTAMSELLAQFDRANRFYAGTLGLVPPLQNKRYQNVRSIDVHILNLESDMGNTGDAEVDYHYRNFDAPSPAITISLANRWRPPNLTPNHELFHAYQYGYTFFKTSWFLEGLARSMEIAFENGVPHTAHLPRNQFELQEVMARSYGADTFWNRLMQLCDPSCKASAAKVGHPQLCGGFMVRPLLEQYQSLDRVAAKDRGIDPSDWPEAEQRSDKNNPYLLRGLHRVLEAQCPLGNSLELSRFHDLLGILHGEPSR